MITMLSGPGASLSSTAFSFWHISKIKEASANLAEKIDAAHTPHDLASALSAWEKELDSLSQSLPANVEPLRERLAQEVEKIIHAQSSERFHATLNGHTHITNRARLLMKHGDAIRNLRGYDSTTGIWAISIAAIQTLLAALMQNASWGNYLLVMLVVGSILNHAAGMTIHEATHNLAAPTPSLNRLVSVLANLPIGIPHQANFERYHLKHHVFLGQPDRDNDLPSPALAQWVGNSSVKKALWLAFYPLTYALTQPPEMPTQKQLANLLIQLAWDASIAYFLGPWALVYLLGSSLTGFSALNPVAAHWIDEHYEHEDDDQETHSYYGWLNLLTFNVGYHNEHHDFPDIPGSRLPELHSIAKDHYGKQNASSSWLNTIWQFISDPKISAHNRTIRTATAQNHTNALAFSPDTPKANIHLRR